MNVYSDVANGKYCLNFEAIFSVRRDKGEINFFPWFHWSFGLTYLGWPGVSSVWVAWFLGTGSCSDQVLLHRASTL